MEKLLSFILGTILFLYIFGIIGKFLLQLFIRRRFSRFNQSYPGGDFGQGFGTNFGANFGSRGGDQNRGSSSQSSSRKEGEVLIVNDSVAKKRIKDRVGDYVDFEEVK